MKLAFLAASAASLLIAAPAFAITAAPTPSSTDVQVTGSVATECGIGNQSGGGARSLPETVPLGSLIGPTGEVAANTPISIGFDNVWCNGASNSLVMTVTPLSNPAVTVYDHSSFTNYLTLNVTSDPNNQVLPAYFNGASSLSSGSAGTAADDTGINGTLSNTLGAFETGTGKYSQALLSYSLPAIHAGHDRPLAGSYTGSVTITVTPG
jgi:hypothetical protein